MTTGKTIALTRRIFGGKIMSLFFNMPGINMREWLPSPIFLPGEVHLRYADDTPLMAESEEPLHQKPVDASERGE